MRKILGKIVSIRNRIIRRLFIILQCKLKRIDLKIGNKVSFNQQAVINGKGSVIIGDKVSIGYKLGGNYYKNRSEFQPRYKDAVIEIGDEVAFNNNIFICCAQRVKIGNNCLVGEGVTILDFEAHGTSPYNRHKLGNKKEVIIGNNVWIGSKVIILKGAKIGDNSIIAAGSVVLGKEYPSNVIIGGNPARIIKEIENE
mgnify:CR=1 FL=1